MAMGIVSDKDFVNEKDKLAETPVPKPPSTVVEIVEINRGRGEGSTEVPNGLRKLIGEEAVINGRQSGLELASNFDVSPSSVSAYTKGAHSTASYEDRPNVSHINQAKERIAKRARVKLMGALRHITKEKLENEKARDLAGIAKDMSAVIRNMEPEQERAPNTGGPTFIFYSPQFKSEKHFEIVNAQE